MKKFIFTLILMFVFIAANAQSMKVYQDGQLKAIYYVSKDDKIEFSDDFPFPDNTDQDEYEYVDLGLSVKWATKNIGAKNPEGYGYYFAWGETVPQADKRYDWNSYKWCDDIYGAIITKYNKGDKKTVLEADDDAATVNWGGSWRIPTKAEIDELRNKCYWVWMTRKGANGFKVTGPNGNYIFLPAAGMYNYEFGLIHVDSQAAYMSSSLESEGNAYSIRFSETVGCGSSYATNRRCDGCSIRPVCP